MPALNHIVLVYRHVVAQIVKAHLVICAVSNIGCICGAALLIIKPVDD